MPINQKISELECHESAPQLHFFNFMQNKWHIWKERLRFLNTESTSDPWLFLLELRKAIKIEILLPLLCPLSPIRHNRANVWSCGIFRKVTTPSIRSYKKKLDWLFLRSKNDSQTCCHGSAPPTELPHVTLCRKISL